jgi:hypothetical protein
MNLQETYKIEQYIDAKIYIQTPQSQDTRFLRVKLSWCEKEKLHDRSPLKQFHYQQLREYMSLL